VTAEGGTSYGHSVVVSRSERPYGPFVPSPHGPLLTHRERRRHPIQATGHADLVELEDGSTWAVLLGIRPSAGRNQHLGRETFLAPVTWSTDGWPRMAPVELRAQGPALRRPAVRPPADRDEFAGRTLARSWLFVRNPSSRDWSLRQRPGCLRLWGSALSLSEVGSPAFVGRRQQHLEATVRTLLEFEPEGRNEEAGICIRANEEFHVGLVVGRGVHGRELCLAQTRRGRTRRLGGVKLGLGPVTLVIEATALRYTFLAGTGACVTELGRVPTRALSAETILGRTGRHHFTGAVIGLFATGNGRRSTVPADFHWFEYVPGAASAA
jgi:xylan 1,4-beta-xylosidase